jgi:inosose dehydratase
VTTTPSTSASATSSTPPAPGQSRIAGAPISWGVCEVPNWGYQLSPSRVLDEMRDVGLAATELGPEGFLPADPEQMAGVRCSRPIS